MVENTKNDAGRAKAIAVCWEAVRITLTLRLAERIGVTVAEFERLIDNAGPFVVGPAIHWVQQGNLYDTDATIREIERLADMAITEVDVRKKALRDDTESGE